MDDDLRLSGCFWQEEREEGKSGSREPEQYPDRPSPALGLDGKATNKGPKDRTASREQCPESDNDCAIFRPPHVGQRCAASRERRACHEACEKSQRKEGAKVVREGGRDLQKYWYAFSQ